MALLSRFCISRSDLTFQAVSWRGICGCTISSGLLTLKLSSLSMFGTFDIRDLCGLSHKTSSECVLGSVEESIQLDHDCNSTEESSTMQLVPPRSPEINGVCGHPIDNPRVGLPVQIMWLDDHKASSGEGEGCGSLSHTRDAALKNESSKSKKCKKHCTVKKEVSDLNAELLDDVKGIETSDLRI
ncbi:hypothetical protein OIU79_018610 [Salix purpurea]|uniref:Uncharacterized protein n=1 Tax=Salix purpurea TaxID=77065 RepID=A0A9Q0WYN4_SALPP|nr:hypothetical protein OIU79_018610 [Salix purpurea]